ncbi:SPOR domain-containing protein [Dechloromonas hortensis]|uniref:SPOR domain-containing protein n=1 Tax=Dechloromonas hortensis TaxID=337779 RepID=UPI00129243F7|nr:SPOR domain-containing protein [Dechloromonas hortensis]
MQDNDAQLQLKKRARRRLVGAVAFVSVVAVVLPMVMDHEPRQVVPDVEIRIPGQDEKPFAPKFAAAPVEKASEKPVVATPTEAPVAAPVEPKVAVAPSARVVEVAKDKPVEKATEKPPAKVEKPAEKPAAKPEKPAEKPIEKPAAKPDDAKRAAAILAGQAAEAKPAVKSGEYLVLIGAFSNEANVKNLKTKLGEQGIKTYSEPLETPQGKKTRVRAGPFASREAAEKALEKMQRIGVSGVVTAKQ